MSGCRPMIAARPSSTVMWSSAINTRILSLCALIGSGRGSVVIARIFRKEYEDFRAMLRRAPNRQLPIHRLYPFLNALQAEPIVSASRIEPTSIVGKFESNRVRVECQQHLQAAGSSVP